LRHRHLEIRVDGSSRLLAEDLPGLETAGKTVRQQALVRGLIAARYYAEMFTGLG
jgi:hypothetical protein